MALSRGSLLGRHLNANSGRKGAFALSEKSSITRYQESLSKRGGTVWRRDLPFIYVANQLLFVGKLGMDVAFIDEAALGPKKSILNGYRLTLFKTANCVQKKTHLREKLSMTRQIVLILKRSASIRDWGNRIIEDRLCRNWLTVN